MERAGASLLSCGPPAEGGPPTPMDQSQAKRPRPPSETEQVRATPVAPHGPWPRPHHTQQQPCCMLAPPMGRAAACKPQADNSKTTQPTLHWACLAYGRGPSRPGDERVALAARPEARQPLWAHTFDNTQTAITPQIALLWQSSIPTYTSGERATTISNTAPPAPPPIHTTLLTIDTPTHAPHEHDSADEEQLLDSDALYNLSFHQTGDFTLHDTTVYAAIVELLLELEGVDLEPDFWTRSSRGPWHIAVNDDSAQQFQKSRSH